MAALSPHVSSCFWLLKTWNDSSKCESDSLSENSLSSSPPKSHMCSSRILDLKEHGRHPVSWLATSCGHCRRGEKMEACKLCISSSTILDTLSSYCPPMVAYLQPRASKHFSRLQLNDRKLKSCFFFFFFWVFHHLTSVSSCDTKSAKLSARLTCFMSASPPLVFCLCWGRDFPFMTKQVTACEFEQLKCKMNIRGGGGGS